MKKTLNKNYKFIIGLIVGLIISATLVYGAEQIISDKDVSYDNTESNGTSDNVQGAIDELYSKVKDYTNCENSNCNIISAYKYDENSKSSTHCITGDEKTCERTTCYKQKNQNSCQAGTIIKYKVNDTTTSDFNVMFDKGTTLTLQSQQNIVSNIEWSNGNTSSGPITILEKLEEATKNWNNVNTFDYSIGDNASTLGYSGCSSLNSCSINNYELTRKSVNVRMITVNEAVELGCSENNSSCPIWMYNCLSGSNRYGNNCVQNVSFYWTLLVHNANIDVWTINYLGQVSTFYYTTKAGARAVVEINK